MVCRGPIDVCLGARPTLERGALCGAVWQGLSPISVSALCSPRLKAPNVLQILIVC